MTNTGWKLNRTNINTTQEKINLSKRKFSPTKTTLPVPTTTNNCIGKPPQGLQILGGSNKTGSPSIRNNIVSNSTDINTAEIIRQKPHCVVADTDSIELCIDAGSNRWIVNHQKLLFQLHHNQGRVKGSGGATRIISGAINLSIVLKSEDGTSKKFMVKVKNIIHANKWLSYNNIYR